MQKQLETFTKEKAALEASLNTCLEKNREEKRSFITKITEINENVMKMKACYESTGKPNDSFRFKVGVSHRFRFKELGKRVGELMESMKKRDAEVKKLQTEIDKLNNPMEFDQPDNSNDEPPGETDLAQTPKAEPPNDVNEKLQKEPKAKLQPESTCDYTNEEVENLKIWLHEYQAIIGNCKRCSAAVAEL